MCALFDAPHTYDVHCVPLTDRVVLPRKDRSGALQQEVERYARVLDDLYTALQQEYTFIDELLIRLLKAHMERLQPKLVAISVPFPGNLYSSLRCGQWIKQNYPGVKVAMGGGFANTELRSLSDARVFEF